MPLSAKLLFWQVLGMVGVVAEDLHSLLFTFQLSILCSQWVGCMDDGIQLATKASAGCGSVQFVIQEAIIYSG